MLREQEYVGGKRAAKPWCVWESGQSTRAGASGISVRFNRQLSEPEKSAIGELSAGDKDKKHRLEAAGCALVHCSAEFVPGISEHAQYAALEREGANYATEQAQLLNFGGSYLTAGRYGGMVRQTPGDGLFRYSAADTQIDFMAMQSGRAAQRPGRIDYVSIQGGAGFGGSISVNLHSGEVYGGWTVAASRQKGAGIVAGMIPDNVGKPADEKSRATDAFLRGRSAGGNACLFGVCGGVNHALGGQTAIEGGIGFGGATRAPNPGGNATGGYGAPLFRIPGIGNAPSK